MDKYTFDILTKLLHGITVETGDTIKLKKESCLLGKLFFIKYAFKDKCVLVNRVFTNIHHSIKGDTIQIEYEDFLKEFEFYESKQQYNG